MQTNMALAVNRAGDWMAGYIAGHRAAQLPPPRKYYGVFLHPQTPSHDGIRWTAFGERGLLRADTLEGIKRLVRNDLKIGQRR